MAVTTITNGLIQVAGVKYTVITDSSSDWASVSNDVYFRDKTTGLIYYKNGSGTVISLFESGGGNTIYTADDSLTGNRTINSNGNTLIFDASSSYTAIPFELRGYPFAGSGTAPYLKIKGYGEVEILGRLSALFNVQNGAGTKQFEVLNGTTKINGAAQINSTYFQVLTDTQKMSFNAGNGGALHHEIRTNGGGGPIKTKFNIPGGSYQFIVGASAIVNSEKISLQGSALIKGEGTSFSTTNFSLYNDDTTPAILLDSRDNGQIGFGGVAVSANAYTFRNPAGKGTIARFDHDVSNTPSFTIAQSGSFSSSQSGNAVFWSYRQSGISYIKLFDAGTENVRLARTGSRINSSLVVGGTTLTAGARFEVQQASTNVAQQLFFANAKTSTAGRLGSDTGFGSTQAGFECYDTDLNKKFFWNGSAWEQIVSGGATSGIGTKVLVQGKMDTTQSFAASTDERIDFVDTGGFDINGEWDNTNHKFVVGSSGAGVYQFMNSLFIQNNAGWCEIYLKKNGTAIDFRYGTEWENQASSWEGVNGHWNIELAVGDEIEFWIKSTAAFSFNATFYDYNVFQITKIGDSVTVINADPTDPRIATAASTATLTINSDAVDQSVITAQAEAITIAAPTGSPVEGRNLIFRFKDDGTARGITWNAIFRAIGITLPTTTTASKLLYVGCKYNSTDTKWDVVSVQEEA